MANLGGGQVASEVPVKEPDSESDDDDEVIETSPCGRWEKHKKELSQRNGPGIDSTFLAMDTEEGVEVVWNEVRFSERKSMKNKEETFKKIFENLTQLDHANIAKFHKYWVDMKGEYPRLIFIAEYMTSGSLRQFLKKTRANVKSFNIKGWKRWCKQILSALGYLHGHKDYPIVHGNLNCDTIFIQHNGLMKIGTVAPDAINNYVKTYKHQRRNMHFIAPEYDGESLFSALSSEEYGAHGVNGRPVNCAADIYSFGIVALEMATLQWAEASTTVTSEMILSAIESLEDQNQRDFIQKCLQKNPADRPTVRSLLVHPVMLEVYSLKILAGHALVDNDLALQQVVDDIEEHDPDYVMAEIKHAEGCNNVQMKYSQVQPLELEKFLEEIKTGLYPLTGMESTKTKKESRPQLNLSRPKSPEDVQNNSQGSEEEELKEVRQIIQMNCFIKQPEDGSGKILNLLLKLEDRMNRQLSRKITDNENPMELANDLVHHGLISEVDLQKVATKIEESLKAPA